MDDKKRPEPDPEAEENLSDGQRAWLEICRQQRLDPRTGLPADTRYHWRKQQRQRWQWPT